MPLATKAVLQEMRIRELSQALQETKDALDWLLHDYSYGDTDVLEQEAKEKAARKRGEDALRKAKKILGQT